MLVVGKEASTLSTLHGIAICVKHGTRKIASSNRYLWKAVTALSEHLSLFPVVYLISLCGGFI